MYCHECGTNINQESTFCTNCGTKIERNSNRNAVINDNPHKINVDQIKIIDAGHSTTSTTDKTFVNNSKKLTREQMWEEIRTGKRKQSLFFKYANTALACGICALVGLLGAGLIFAIAGLYNSVKSLKDQNESNSGDRIKAWVGLILSVIGFGIQMFIYSLKNI